MTVTAPPPPPPTPEEHATVTAYLTSCGLAGDPASLDHLAPRVDPECGTVVFEGTRADLALWALGRHDPAGRTFAVVALPEEGA